ncbi:MAG: TRAM domain-containing protein [Bifidobacteriaceae bacterium]|nr:TRAM domain-containing protein [Bifidobacteriaceae bacterium]
MDEVELRVGGVAHGGCCVARLDGRVVFVRHTLPGEVIVAEVLERRAQFWRAEAVRVLEPSPDRVPHVWPAAGPGGVGGADLGHVTLPAQQRWKAEAVRQALRRIGHIERDVEVRAAPGDAANGGLGWRTRLDLEVDDAGRPGMHAPRSGRVIAVDSMPLAVPALAEHAVFQRRWPGVRRIHLVAPSVGGVGVLVDGGGPAAARWLHEAVEVVLPAGRWGADGWLEELPVGAAADGPMERPRGPIEGPRGGAGVAPPGTVVLPYRVRADGFWQVHKEAPQLLVEAVLAAAVAGVAFGLAGSGGGGPAFDSGAAGRAPGGVGCVGGPDSARCPDSAGGSDSARCPDSVGGPDSARCPDSAGGPDSARCPDSAGGPGVPNSTGVPNNPVGLGHPLRAPGEWNRWPTVWDLYSGSGLFTVPLALTGADVWAVEADPAANRAARRNAHGLDGIHLVQAEVATAIKDLPAPDLVVLDPPRRGAGARVSAAIVQARPRRVIYVACDPAALARDAAALIRGGYRLGEVSGLDLFPHTHHVECVAIFER